MATTGWLRVIRRLAIVGVVLSVLALPLGLTSLVSALSPDIGDNGMGDVFALAVGVSFLILGAAGVILGSALAVLAKRSLEDPFEIRGSRRTVLTVGLIFAGVQVVISMMLGGGWLLNAMMIAAFASGYLVVGVTSQERGVSALAGVLAVALLALGVFPLLGLASQSDVGARRDERVALLPTEWQAALDDAAAAAPDGWAIPTLTARVTDFAPIEDGRFLPAELVGHGLRGIIVIDCAGSERLVVVARDRDAPAQDATVVLGTSPCRAVPQVLSIEIPAVTVDADPSGTYVLGISVDLVDEGPTGGMSRTLLLVAIPGTPDPDREALLSTFVAAFGTDMPR